MKEELIKRIIEKYGIESPLNKIKNIKGYPHIKILFFDEDYVIKKVNKVFCKDVDTLYNYLSKSNYIELPIKTIDDSYGLKVNDDLFLLYPKLKKINGEIQSFYWAKALESIHNIPINIDDFNKEYTVDKECYTLLRESNELISQKIRNRIKKLLDKYYPNMKVGKLVLSHGDPYDNNVMNDKTNIKLIDTDGTRLFPEEYDIARLFYNEVNREKNIDNI